MGDDHNTHFRFLPLFVLRRQLSLLLPPTRKSRSHPTTRVTVLPWRTPKAVHLIASTNSYPTTLENEGRWSKLWSRPYKKSHLLVNGSVEMDMAGLVLLKSRKGNSYICGFHNLDFRGFSPFGNNIANPHDSVSKSEHRTTVANRRRRFLSSRTIIRDLESSSDRKWICSRNDASF